MERFKILLLEDADRDAELITFELSKANMPVVIREVRNRDSFLQALEEFRPHLILTDHRLPSFDGLMALALAQEISPEIPFIFVSDIMSGGLDESLETGEAKFGPEFDGIMAHLADGSLIVFLDPDRRILEFNHGAQLLTGWQRAEVLGQDALNLFVPGEKRLQVKAKLNQILAGEPAGNLDLPLQLRNGSQKRFRLDLTLLRNAQDQPLGILMVGHEPAKSSRDQNLPQSGSKRPTPIVSRAVGLC